MHSRRSLHAPRLRHVSERGKENVWIGVLTCRCELLGNGLVVFEIIRHIKGRISPCADMARTSRAPVGNMYPQNQEGFGNAQTTRLSSRLANQANLQHSVSNFDVGFDAAWELDFWGRFRCNVEATDASLLATVADYDNALVLLTAEVASTYAEMRTFEVLIQIAYKNVKIQKEGLEIAESRFRNGATSELDVTQARSLYESGFSLSWPCSPFFGMRSFAAFRTALVRGKSHGT